MYIRRQKCNLPSKFNTKLNKLCEIKKIVTYIVFWSKIFIIFNANI